MLDVSGSVDGNLPLLRAAADQLITRLQPKDAARVGTFGHDVAISPTFTRDAGQLRSALPAAIAPDAPTPLWRALDAAMTAFGDERDDERRRVIGFAPPQRDGKTHKVDVRLKTRGLEARGRKSYVAPKK